MRAVLVLLFSCLALGAQTVSYFNLGFLRQPSAAADRAYLGLTNATSVYGTLASADFANQGTTTTVLHGNAAGNPYWDTVNLVNEVDGNLGVSHLNSGTGAGATTFWCGNGTWAVPAGTPMLDIRTNEFNAFLGTNRFDTNVYIMGKLGINFTNFADADYTSSSIVWKRVPYNFPTTVGASLLFGPNSLADPSGAGMNDGSSIISKQDMEGAGSASATLELLGSPLFIGTEATRPLIFVIAGIPVGQINNSSGNLLMGRGNIAASSLYGTGYGGVLGTNFIHSKQYVRAESGLVVNSNSWLRVPSFVIPGSADTFNSGDNWYVSSNSYPAIVFKDPNSVVNTQYLFKPFLCLSSFTSGSNYVTLPGSGTYALMTNWDYSVTNYMYSCTTHVTNGFCTNILPGFYRVSFSISTTTANNNDGIEADFSTNSAGSGALIPSDVIAAHWATTTAGGKEQNGSASGILYMEAGTRFGLMIKNLSHTDLTITHAQLSLSPP